MQGERRQEQPGAGAAELFGRPRGRQLALFDQLMPLGLRVCGVVRHPVAPAQPGVLDGALCAPDGQLCLAEGVAGLPPRATSRGDLPIQQGEGFPGGHGVRRGLTHLLRVLFPPLVPPVFTGAGGEEPGAGGLVCARGGVGLHLAAGGGVIRGGQGWAKSFRPHPFRGVLPEGGSGRLTCVAMPREAVDMGRYRASFGGKRLNLSQGPAEVADGAVPIGHLRGGSEDVEHARTGAFAVALSAEPEARDERAPVPGVAEDGGHQCPGALAREFPGGRGEVVDFRGGLAPFVGDAARTGDLRGDVLHRGIVRRRDHDLIADQLRPQRGNAVGPGRRLPDKRLASERMLRAAQVSELDRPPHHDRGHHVTEHRGLAGAGRPVDGE